MACKKKSLLERWTDFEADKYGHVKEAPKVRVPSNLFIIYVLYCIREFITHIKQDQKPVYNDCPVSNFFIVS